MVGPSRYNVTNKKAGIEKGVLKNKLGILNQIFIDLLVLSIGYQMIDWNSKTKNDYMKACISGATGNHEPMADFILKRLKN